jgi:hypothetical protein
MKSTRKDVFCDIYVLSEQNSLITKIWNSREVTIPYKYVLYLTRSIQILIVKV